MRHAPRSARSLPNQSFCVSGMAENADGSLEREIFEPRRQPAIAAESGAIKLFLPEHIPVNGYDVGKPAKYSADGAIALRAHSMHNIRFDFLEFVPCGANAALIQCTQPADFRHMQTVIPDVRSQLFRGLHRALGAGNNVHFHLSHSGKTLKQGSNGRGKTGRRFSVRTLVLPVVDGKNGHFHFARELSSGTTTRNGIHSECNEAGPALFP